VRAGKAEVRSLCATNPRATKTMSQTVQHRTGVKQLAGRIPTQPLTANSPSPSFTLAFVLIE
jgi:hypothetical protein